METNEWADKSTTVGSVHGEIVHPSDRGATPEKATEKGQGKRGGSRGETEDESDVHGTCTGLY